MMEFKIYDLISKKYLATCINKGEADRKFFELEKKYPNRKLVMKQTK